MTIYEIASLAGVSASTVSRVINGYPYVKKETRELVLRLLAENNYVQNDTARSLVTQESRMVGILIADLRTTHHTEGVYYILEELRKNGYSAIIYNTGIEEENQAKYIQTLGQRRVDAAVLMGSVYQNESVLNAIRTFLPSVPVIMCNGFLDGDNIYGVLSDERSGVRDAVKLLYKKGRRNFAFITNHYTPSNREKLSGFRDGLGECLLDGVEIESGDSVDNIVSMAEELLKSHPKTDAIICADDYTALSALHALATKGVSIPGEVSLMGLNNSRYAEISNPSLSSIDTMLYDTSIIAVRNLIEILNGGRVNHHISLCPVIVERATT